MDTTVPCPAPPCPPSPAAMRYVVALLRSTSRILAAAVDEDNRLSVEPALEGVTHALLMLARRFGDGVEPAALEELRNHRRELVTQIAELRARSLPDWVQNLPRVLDAWEEHLQRSQAADDAHGAALLEHQVKQLAVDAPW